MEGVQYTGAKSEESESLDTEEEETPEDDETTEDEQDSSHDRGSEEDYDDNSNEDAPETPQSEDKSLICKKQKQNKIINMQREQIAELQPTLLKVAEEERKAEFVQNLSDKIAEEKQSIEQQEQSCSQLSDIVQEIRTQLGHALWHIRKKRSGELPQEDVDNIRQYCAKSKEEVDWWLEEYGAKEPEDFESDGESDGESDREDDGEDGGESDGEDGQDDVGVQDGAMLAPVQSFGLMGTITLPFVGGKRGRDVDADKSLPRREEDSSRRSCEVFHTLWYNGRTFDTFAC